ncbi:nucleotide sugar dehydrogenase [Candidatus Woesearchaeota archaeon]|nr:nucleotide sugar dehydrogenase [Candidatus Woesearchaeota archaeon]
MESKDPNSGRSYGIPETIDDRKALDKFISGNAGKKVIAVQGLGFVGAAMAMAAANAYRGDYAVIGVDLAAPESYWKVMALNEGQFPVKAEDPKVLEFYEVARKKKNFTATCDPHAYSLADVIIVDINLDVQKNPKKGKSFDVDLSGFRKAIVAIGKSAKEGVLVLIETTVPPGACEKIVKPILDKAFQERGISKYFLGHSFERVMPGPEYIDSIQNFYRVYAGIDEGSAQETEKFLKTIVRTDQFPLTRLHSTTASEMAKVLENSFRAMNIAFIEEWTEFAEEAGVDLYAVVDAIRKRPTHRNIMLPGLGVGGYCLTKDPLMASWSKKNIFGSKAGLGESEHAVAINDMMPKHTFDAAKRLAQGNLKGKKALLYGVSYRSEVGDTRSTPVGMLYDLLKKEGCTISLQDPYLTTWPEKNVKVEQRIPVEGVFDIIIFCTNHKGYRNNKALQESIMGMKRCIIVDSVGILDKGTIALFKAKHSIKVIGRGDI